MIIYSKSNVKNKKIIARVYIRDNNDTALRLFFGQKDLEKNRNYIENTPDYIKEIFTNSHGDCKHCETNTDGTKKDPDCKFRKTYTVDNRLIEKCSGVVFEIWNPAVDKLSGYIDLLAEVYTPRK